MSKDGMTFYDFMKVMQQCAQVAAEKMNSMSDEQKKAIVNKYVKKAMEQRNKRTPQPDRNQKG